MGGMNSDKLFDELAVEDAREFEPIQEILHNLVEMGEATAYQLERKLKIPHATCHQRLRQALTLNLIEVKKEEKLCTGLTKKTYALTPCGLVEYISNCFFHSRVLKRDVKISPLVHQKISQTFWKQWQKLLAYIPESYALRILSSITLGLITDCRKLNLEQLQKLFLEKLVSVLLWIFRHEHVYLNEIVAFLNSEPEFKETFVRKISERIEMHKKEIVSLQHIQEKIQAYA